MNIFHFNINMYHLSFLFISSVTTIFIYFFLSFSSLILNLLFSITFSFDVRFTIRLFLWLTHSTDFRKTASDNQILHFVLHIFLRTMSGSMKESLYFLWLDYTFIGALKPVMWSVFWFLCNFQYLLRINLFACN